MPYTTPADVLARRRQLMLDGDADGLAGLFGPDAVMEFVFHGRNVLFLKGFNLESAHEMNLFALTAFPPEERRAWHIEFLRDFAKAPAVGAHHHESGLLFGGMHRFWFSF